VHAPFASIPAYTERWLLEELVEEICSGEIWLLAARADLADESL
jgi:hypothetical protein